MGKSQSKPDSDLIKAVKHRKKVHGTFLAARAIKAGANVNVKDDNGDPVLMFAVKAENIDIVKELVKAGADVDAKANYGDPVLVSAVETENIDIVKELLKAGANVDAKANYGDPVLVSAVETKNIDIVNELVKAGADVDAKDRFGYPVLKSAVRTKNIDIVKELLKAGADVDAKGQYGDPVLVSAVKTENIDIVKELVKAGADVDAKACYGDPGLVLAVKTENIDIVKELLKAGADVDAKDDDGNPVLVSAVKTENIDIVKELVKAGADVDAKANNGNPVLVLAVWTENIDIVKELVKAGADVDAKANNWNPVLVLAVWTENIDIVKELVKAGADVDAKANNGNPVLVLAVWTENIDIVKELVKAGADVDAKAYYGNPALVSAVKTKNIDIVKELLKAGADVDAKANYGDPALVSAVKTKNIDIVKELLKAGADVDAKAYYEDPALVSAVKTKNIDIVKELLKAGANVDAKDDNGYPVLKSAVRTKNIDIIKELLKAGADVDARDDDGNPLLVSAVRTENMAFMKKLLKVGADVNAKDRSGNPVLVSAVRTENMAFIKELLKAGANVDAKDDDGNPVLVSAMWTKNINIVKELVKAGADVNVIIKNNNYQSNIRPLHVAVAAAEVDIFQELVNHRAYIDYDNQDEVSALHLVSVETKIGTLRKLYENVRNCHARGKYNRTFLHTAASLGSHQIIKHVMESLLDKSDSWNLKDDFGNSPLHCAVQIGNLKTMRDDRTESRCDWKALDSCGRTLLHLAAIYGHSDLVDLFIDKYGLDPHTIDNQQRNCLHYAVIFRHEDLVCALLQRDANSLKKYNTKDSSGKTPSDYIQSCEKDSLISKYLQCVSVGIEIHVVAHKNYSPDISNVLELKKISKEPSIGSVATIAGHDNKKFVEYVENEVKRVIKAAVPRSQGTDVGQVIGCGSSFEGTKTGMPDEFDFLVKLDSKLKIQIKHEGYGKMEGDPVTGFHGLWLWSILMSFWSDCQTKGEGKTVFSDGQRSMKMPFPPLRHPDRKTCTTWIWLYSDEMFKDLPVSIDFVPAVEVCLEKPGTLILSTWLMTQEEMRKRKLHFVPKIPNKKSDVTKKFESQELHQLGRVSYPTLELEHIQALEDRVKDVYITAKSIRNIEVCRFKVKNDKGDTKLVSELVTSYRLKSVFLQLVELFRESDMSLGKMVLMVYERLEKLLEIDHLPMFFRPDINVLAGSKLSTKESLKVTKIMTRFVRSLYERDFSPEQREHDSAEEKRVIEIFMVTHSMDETALP
ncbi:ankyrin-1-like [Lineus longissimus]|uniref:ankyrin-1-like n=1 Tax=Lineus longissimus TaxID=88925 RepID=UPI00315D197B